MSQDTYIDKLKIYIYKDVMEKDGKTCKALPSVLIAKILFSFIFCEGIKQDMKVKENVNIFTLSLFQETKSEKQTSKKVIHMSRLLQFYMENMILRSGNFQLTS